MNEEAIEFKTFEDYNYFCNKKVYLLIFFTVFVFLIVFLGSYNYMPLILVAFVSGILIYYTNNICEYLYKNAWARLKSFGYDGTESTLAKAKELYYKNRTYNPPSTISFRNNGKNNFTLSI